MDLPKSISTQSASPKPHPDAAHAGPSENPENTARHLWHSMAHPAEMRALPPKIINAASGVEITDLQGQTVLDTVCGLWNVNLGYSCEPVKAAIHDQHATR